MRELFYLNNKLDNTEEPYTELIPDIKKQEDSIQLQDFLQSNKLGEKNWEVDKRLVHIKYICVTFIRPWEKLIFLVALMDRVL